MNILPIKGNKVVFQQQHVFFKIKLIQSNTYLSYSDVVNICYLNLSMIGETTIIKNYRCAYFCQSRPNIDSCISQNKIILTSQSVRRKNITIACENMPLYKIGNRVL